MGVSGLWKIIMPHAVPISLRDHASIRKDQLGRPLTIGVDISNLMGECIAASANSDDHRSGALKILYYELAELLKCSLVLVFVYNSIGGPPVQQQPQRRNTVISESLWWLSQTQDLVQAFGYHIHQVPAEAKSEIPAKERDYPDQYLLFDAKEIQNIEPGLTKGGFLLFALLCGGDYNEGVPGCGPTSALALAKCGFGDRLIDAMEAVYHQLDEPDFTSFLESWRLALRLELRLNVQGNLQKRAPALARNIPDAFPSCKALALYLTPHRLSSLNHSKILKTRRWNFLPPSIPRIAELCEYQS
ncbi:hypothetical protein CVT24_006522 [Panaeolus cyanescens]|uniref:XPG-I domain-containing protein n=1 Tax=Panaeolus cyanescens TaxID=181874 RepID=A0A409WNG1_9AGAR|nr:hypothetical protein CVT24_006522 [Panaeolus cyanescens]